MELTKGSSGVYGGANQSAGQYRWRGGGAEHTHTETQFFFFHPNVQNHHPYELLTKDFNLD